MSLHLYKPKELVFTFFYPLSGTWLPRKTMKALQSLMAIVNRVHLDNSENKGCSEQKVCESKKTSVAEKENENKGSAETQDDGSLF